MFIIFETYNLNNLHLKIVHKLLILVNKISYLESYKIFLLVIQSQMWKKLCILTKFG